MSSQKRRWEHYQFIENFFPFLPSFWLGLVLHLPNHHVMNYVLIIDRKSKRSKIQTFFFHRTINIFTAHLISKVRPGDFCLLILNESYETRYEIE